MRWLKSAWRSDIRGPSTAFGEADSAVGAIRDRDEESPEGEVGSKRSRKPATASKASAIREDPKTHGWTRRFVPQFSFYFYCLQKRSCKFEV